MQFLTLHHVSIPQWIDDFPCKGFPFVRVLRDLQVHLVFVEHLLPDPVIFYRPFTGLLELGQHYGVIRNINFFWGKADMCFIKNGHFFRRNHMLILSVILGLVHQIEIKLPIRVHYLHEIRAELYLLTWLYRPAHKGLGAYTRFRRGFGLGDRNSVRNFVTLGGTTFHFRHVLFQHLSRSYHRCATLPLRRCRRGFLKVFVPFLFCCASVYGALSYWHSMYSNSEFHSPPVSFCCLLL